MIKIMLLLMGLISLFTACEQDDTDNGIELGDVKDRKSVV